MLRKRALIQHSSDEISCRRKPMAKKTIGLTVFLIKPNTSSAQCLRTTKSTSSSEFEFPDGSKASIHTFSTPPQAPKWHKFLSAAIESLPAVLSSSASAVLFVSTSDRLFALTFGYGRSLLSPGAWEEDFGLKVTLNSVDRTKIKTVDRMTLDAIGQHSRIQASRDASIGEFGLDLEQDFLMAVTGKSVISKVKKN